MSVVAEEALRAAADALHKILASESARRLIDRDLVRGRVHDQLSGRILDPVEIERLCADGFSKCVLALRALGAPDVAVHECGDVEEHW